MIQSPCKDCEKRRAHPNCHADCDAYVQYMNACYEARNRRYSESTLRSDRIRQIEKTKRKKHLRR